MTKMIQSDEQKLVVKSNHLVEAKYSLTLREQKIIIYITSQIKKDDKEFQMYHLPIRKFCDLMGMKGNPRYSEIEQITDGLQRKLLKVRKGDKIYSANWLSLVVYDKRTGTISMKFDPFLKPLLLQLKTEFTKYKLADVINMKSTYSIRLYELLKQHLYKGNRTITIEQLRDFFGLEDKDYPLYGNLKQKAIKVAINEINEKSDINVEMKENKIGRRVDSVTFSMRSKVIDDPTLNVEVKSLETWLESVLEGKGYFLTESTFSNWVRMASTIWKEEYDQGLRDTIENCLVAPKIHNQLAFITHILHEKEKAVKAGKDHTLVSVNSPNEKPIRKEMLPSWFNEQEEQGELELDDNFEIEKRKLEEELRKRKEAKEKAHSH